MEKRALMFTLFLIIIPVYVNSSRFLVGDESSNSTSGKILTVPPESNSPIKTEKSSVNSIKSESQNHTELEPPVQPDKKDQIQTNNTNRNNKNDNSNNNTVLSPPESENPKNGTETGTETKKEGQIGYSQHYFCDDVSEKCFNENNWVACLQSSNDSKELFLLVENKGQNEISIDINFTPSIILQTKKLPLSKNDSRKVKIIKTDSNEAANITLNSGKGDCILHINPSKTLIFPDFQLQLQQLTNYFPTQFTPIYALYFLLFTLLIFIITFACCKFTKSRNRNIISYQQLEMNETATSSRNATSSRTATSSRNAASSRNDDVAGNGEVAETADGWEKGWDDDWEDEEIGRGVSVNNNDNFSGNNNNKSSVNKDGWDVDWDD